jgi:hypothetical protein
MSAKRCSRHWFCSLLSLGLVLHGAARADSVPFWGAKASVPIDTPVDQLKKGQFLFLLC